MTNRGFKTTQFDIDYIIASHAHALTEVFETKTIDTILQLAATVDKQDIAVSAGYAYDRKGCLSMDVLDRDRNLSYGREGDDMVVQVTMTVPKDSALYAHMEKEAKAKKVEYLMAEITARRDKIDKLQEEQTKAIEDLEAVQF